MATLRKWLTEAGFKWEAGRIIFHAPTDDSYSPGWGEAKSAEVIAHDHPMLDAEFSDGYGAPQCPRFIADDGERIYFPCQYDGATWVSFIHKNIDHYLDPKNETPYPGG